MSIARITPKGIAAPIGAYSHAIQIDVGNYQLIFITGQIAMSEDGMPVAPGDIERQTHFIFKSIASILKEVNGSLDDIVKVVIYVKDVTDFPKISAIRNEYLATARPTSTLVEISNTVKEGCDIEIEATAVISKTT